MQNLIFLLFLSLSLSVSGQRTLDDENLSGKVKSYRILTYSGITTDDGKTTKGAYSPSYTQKDWKSTFNENGAEIETVEYFNEDEIALTTIYTYDGAGRLIDIIGKRDYTASHNTFEYDQSNRLIQENWTINDKTDQTVTYNYSSEGNLISQQFVNAAGEQSRKSEWSYDENDQPIIEKTYYGQNTPVSILKRTYDEKGNRIKDTLIGADNKLVVTYEYHYDEEGILTEKKTFGPDGTEKQSESYSYDEYGNILQCAISRQGKVETSTNEYVYDSNGNWIVRIESGSNGRSKYIERTIEYY